MLILFWNLSFLMFNNAAMLIAVKDSETLKKIGESISIKDNKPDTILLNTINNFYSNGYIKYLEITDSEGKILYSNGTKINKRSNSKNFSFKKDKDIMEIKFSIKETIHFNIIYDLYYISTNYFQYKREIFLIVSILSFMILFFLSIMILNLQRRLTIAEAYINELKTTDEDTGLLSKDQFLKLFKKEVERIQRTSGKVTLLTIDIDNFLIINQKYGYDFGLIILQTVSKIIESNFRNFDLISRFGDDEFMVLMVDSDESNGFEAAERCRNAIEENKFYYEGKEEVTITVSIGIADSQTSFESSKRHPSESGPNFFRTILFNSLNALARAKRDGRNRIVKYTEL